MTINPTLARTAVVVPLFAAAMSVQLSSASAYSKAVKRACMGDYLSHCSHTKPGSSKLDRCMRKAGARLSSRCVKALSKAGMVSKAQMRRHTAKK